MIVRDSKSGTSADTKSGQGYGDFRSGDVNVAWKDSSDAFAVTMRGTKRTWHTDVYIREGKAWVKLEFPPYVANILGRQGVFEGGRSFREAFGGFRDDNRFTLFSHIELDWKQQAQTAEEADWKPTTQTEWRIELEYHPRMQLNCTVVKISPFIEKNNEQDGARQPLTDPESKSLGEEEREQESEDRLQ
ncbi:MAG: hypothetical protein AAF585_05765 [Verrucomicrobiota bacterium]